MKGLIIAVGLALVLTAHPLIARADDDDDFLKHSQTCTDGAQHGAYCAPTHEDPKPIPAQQNGKYVEFRPGCVCENWDTAGGQYFCALWKQTGPNSCDSILSPAAQEAGREKLKNRPPTFPTKQPTATLGERD